jgi:hypothetical protein
MERSVVEGRQPPTKLFRKGAIRSKVTTLEEAYWKDRTIFVLPRFYAVDVRAGVVGLERCHDGGGF